MNPCSKLALVVPAVQASHDIMRQDFKQLATTWKYQGFPNGIVLEWIDNGVHLEMEEYRVYRVHDILKNDTIEEAVMYMISAGLKSATVPGVVEYTLTGGRQDG